MKMGNEVAKAQLPAEYRDYTQAFLDALAASPVPLLKFKKGKYFVQDVEVPLGSKFIAYCGDWVRGWVKFVDGELVDKKIGRVADRFVVPERDELDDRDPINWSKDDDGEPIDPWVRQDYLPLESSDSGERFLFVTSSFGGRIGVEILCQRWVRNITKGRPTIKLEVGEFSTKRYPRIPRPDFVIVDWDGDAPEVLVITPKAANEGPPDYDPADPRDYE
jgi:hypothetical protein